MLKTPVESEKWTPEQRMAVMQWLMSRDGYVTVDTKKCDVRDMNHPHKFCYQKHDNAEAVGLIVKTKRILRVLQFMNDETREEYITKYLGKHVEVKNDKKV